MSTFQQVLTELASSEVPVLLIGEPGVGKRVVARQIHASAPWHDAPFVQFNCRQVVESQIRAAFGPDGTGQNSPSTVYFDGVEALSSTLQRILFSCLEGDLTRRWPRVIASGTAELETEVRTGRFREDLYYRLSGICLPIPPLRYRKQDIKCFADEYLGKYAAQFSRPKPELTPQLLRFLQVHPWRGNLRELEDAMRTIVAVGDVRVAIAALRTSAPLHNRDKKNGNESVSLKQVARAASHRAERELILRVLSRTNGNRKRAAEELRISYKALLYKLKEIGSTSLSLVGPGGKSE
jgi:two-component system, NtrC family, response regulator AtoC